MNAIGGTWPGFTGSASSSSTAEGSRLILVTAKRLKGLGRKGGTQGVSRGSKRTPERRRRARRPVASLPPEPEIAIEALPFGLTPLQYTFALTWASNGFNGAAAYRAASPKVLDITARTEGSRTLALPNVRAFLASLLGARWKAEQMDGDEALGRVARDARADIRLLYDDKGELLTPNLWPDEIAGSIKSIADGPYGLKVTLVDPLTARRIILEQTGKLKNPLEGAIDALADAIRADVARTTKA